MLTRLASEEKQTAVDAGLVLAYQGQVQAEDDRAAAAIVLDRYPGAQVTLRPAAQPGFYTFVAVIGAASC